MSLDLLTLTKPMILAGDLYIGDPSSDGTFPGLTGPYETAKFNLKPNVKTQEQLSMANDTYGQVRSSIVIPDKTEITIEFLDVHPEVMAIFQLGETSAFSQGSGTLTDFAITAAFDKWFETGHGNLSTTGLTIKSNDGATTFVLGKDYDIEFVTGRYRIRSTGAIALGAHLKMNGTYAAIDGTSVSMGTKILQKKGLLLLAKNLDDGSPMEIGIYKSKLRPNSDFSAKDNKHISLTLAGILETPAGLGGAGYIRYR